MLINLLKFGNDELALICRNKCLFWRAVPVSHIRARNRELLEVMWRQTSFVMKEHFWGLGFGASKGRSENTTNNDLSYYNVP